MANCKKLCEDFASLARNKIIIQVPAEVGDAYGGFAVTWASTYTLWSYAIPTTMKEQWQSELLQSKVTHRFYIRYNSNLKDTKTVAKNRISFDGRLFQIVGIRNLDRMMKYEGKVYQEIQAVENEAGND